MQTTFIGNKAEAAAAAYLMRHGYSLVARNWRRRECEIDIVAQHDGRVHFFEVKYRQSDIAGSGMDYITEQKLKRMAYAAQRWVAEANWRGEYVLAAIEVSGDSYEVTACIDCIDIW